MASFPLPSHCLKYFGCYMYLAVKGRHQGLCSYFTRGYTRSRLCPLVYSRAPLYYDFPLYISALWQAQLWYISGCGEVKTGLFVQVLSLMPIEQFAGHLICACACPADLATSNSADSGCQRMGQTKWNAFGPFFKICKSSVELQVATINHVIVYTGPILLYLFLRYFIPFMLAVSWVQTPLELCLVPAFLISLSVS